MVFGVCPSLFSWRSLCPPPLGSRCGRRFFRRWKRQRKPREVAEEFECSLRTVQRLYQQFEDRGEAAIVPAYARCGQNHPHRTPDVLVRKAQAMRDQHPRWGAGLIRLMIQPKDADQEVPAARTLIRSLSGRSSRVRAPTAKAMRPSSSVSLPTARACMPGCRSSRPSIPSPK